MTAPELFTVTRAAPNGDTGFTLSALMHNESYFLPAFLDHYRSLGVQHFVLLDDASADVSREIALTQPDVTLLESAHRYGDMLPRPDGTSEKAKMLWRRGILSRWTDKRWSLHIDLDEFIDLPDGVDFPALAGQLDRAGKDTVYGAMVDLYPDNLSDFDTMSTSFADDLHRQWYFDAVPHLVSHPFGAPAEVYGGTRGRLTVQYGIPFKPPPPTKRLTNRIFGNSAPFLHRVRKAVMLKWSNDRRMRNEHTITPAKVAKVILPVRHYKFTPSLAGKVRFALESGSYAKNSGQYRLLDDLLLRMASGGGSFLGNTSKPYSGFRGFKEAGIARGF